MNDLFRNNAPFHPADAFFVRLAYTHGMRAGRRNPDAAMEPARDRWLRRHADEHIATRLPDWEDGFKDGQFMASV